jgi:hypothetical protein
VIAERAGARHTARHMDSDDTKTGGFRPGTTLRREVRFFVLIAAFGLLLLPLLVYLAGLLTLGPYEGGLLAFLGSLYKAFVTFKLTAWILLLGPYVLFWVLRLLTRPMRKRRAS